MVKGLILFITAKILIIIVYPIAFTWSISLTFFKNGWKEVDRYLYNCAIADDQHGNTYVAKFFNDLLIKPGGYRFGNHDETISSVLGKNKLTNTLTLLGKILDAILNRLEREHSVKSIEIVDTKKNLV